MGLTMPVRRKAGEDGHALVAAEEAYIAGAMRNVGGSPPSILIVIERPER